MDVTKLTVRGTNYFVNNFIEEEKDFLFSINSEAFYEKRFPFYIGWFLYTINYYMKEKNNIQKEFEYFFYNNYSLDISFFPYIMNKEFREKAQKYIVDYKKKYGEEKIYE